jgi:hypothetical protein
MQAVISRGTMTQLQHIGLALFVLFTFGFALGYKQDCPDGSQVETFMLDGVAAKLVGRDLCQP